MKESVPNKDTLLVFDGDLILYQKGFKHENTEEWWVVEADIERWIAEFFEKFGTYNYILYLTGKGNFREEVAVSHPYKGNRTKPKPKWYDDIKQYLIHMHHTKVVEGIEADDACSMNITRNPNSILISIDKDLLMVEGWHYRFATHNSPEVPLRYIEHKGFLELVQKGKKKVIKGGGFPWFYSQMLLGDKTDHIFGVKGYGDVKVYKAFEECETEKDYYDVVKEAYENEYGEQAEARIRENADLLYMIKGVDENGDYIKWEIPDGNS